MDFKQDINFANAEIIGKRQRQEDYCAFALLKAPRSLHNGLLAILADGMGGHQAGDKASKIAVEAIYTSFVNSKLSIEESLRNAINYANAEIAYFAKTNNKKGSGATAICAYINKEKTALHWASVGDSLLYILRDNHLSRVNADHSLWPELKMQAEQGIISIEEAKANAHILKSALDGNKLELVEITAKPYPIQKDDIIILASDGIESIEETKIVNFIRERNLLSAMGIACGLLNLVENKNKSGQDNTSIMAIKV